MPENVFKTIFSQYDTDKVVPGNYHIPYEESFLEVRNNIELMFEIGVNRGGSVKGFRDYFPNAKIVGIEIDPKSVKAQPKQDRIFIELADATNKSHVDNILNKYGQPDIVIDDGSHLSSHMKKSFKFLWPYTKFCYVIEDYATQKEACAIDDGIPATGIALKKVEELILGEGTCKSVRAYNHICFFFK